MAVDLNHVIIPSHDKVGSSRFLAEILGIDSPRPFADPNGHNLKVFTAVPLP
jgi:hypothetical protein